jgi:hypothetical protein
MKNCHLALLLPLGPDLAENATSGCSVDGATSSYVFKLCQNNHCLVKQSPCCLVFCLQVDIDTVEKFESLRAAEQQYFVDLVQKCKDAGGATGGGSEGWVRDSVRHACQKGCR